VPFGGSAKVCAVIIPQCVSCAACTRSLALASGICCRQVYSKLKLTLRLLLRRSKLEGGLVLTSWCPNAIVSFSTEFSTSDFHVHAFSFGSRNSSPRVQYTPHQWSHHQNSHQPTLHVSFRKRRAIANDQRHSSMRANNSRFVTGRCSSVPFQQSRQRIATIEDHTAMRRCAVPTMRRTENDGRRKEESMGK